ncbi:MAG TPA: hypothetical protein VKU37_04200 [Verrucomicrobiae bacterium]|nr:hypothetical protein [Verrucomicrobiae bacterium]
MKINSSKFTLLSLLATALMALPMLASAQDANTNTPASSEQSTTTKPQKHGFIPFHGKLNAVDASAKTLTVGNRTFQVTADTKIFSNGEPAALSDGVVGEPVRGAYKKTEAGLLEAVTVHFGAKTGEKPNPENSSEH